MRLPERDGAQRERVVAILTFGQRLKIDEQGDGGVVLGRFPGGDHRLDARPRGVFLVGQFVESSFTGIEERLFPACLVVGALGGGLEFTVGSSPRRVIEQVGHGPAGWDGDSGGGAAAETALQRRVLARCRRVERGPGAQWR